MSFTIAIIGRPNVGKSTLFNRLAGRKLAVVDDMPGVTRDRHIAKGSLGALEFNIIDTAGLEKDFSSEIEEKAFSQTGKALDDADIALFIIDGRAGITPLDEHFARWLRKKNRKVILVINKCESKSVQGIGAESYRLGFGEPIGISAEHGEGFADLYEALENAQSKLALSPENIVEDSEKNLRITIAGRPNSGKSTLFNAILGEERSVTSSEAGTTRDSVSITTEFDGRKFEMIDTAGMRRKSNINTKVERTSVGQSLRAIRFANVVVLLLDATLKMEKQDLSIADLALSEGRALVIAVNKWDLIKDHTEVLQDIKDRLEKSLPQVKELPLIFISAKIGKNLDKLIEACFAVFETWNTEISTSKLNRWLEKALETHTPPLIKGRRLKIRYMTQIASRPPSFALFVSNKADFPESYLRYLQNSLKEEFDLQNIVVRMTCKKNKNPFDQEKN